jgi:outer membrane protein TolC
MADGSSIDSAGLEQQLLEAREEAELTLQQLHLVQEELEHYFLSHEEAQAKLQRYQQEQQRAEVLIEALLARLEVRGA